MIDAFLFVALGIVLVWLSWDVLAQGKKLDALRAHVVEVTTDIETRVNQQRIDTRQLETRVSELFQRRSIDEHVTTIVDQINGSLKYQTKKKQAMQEIVERLTRDINSLS